MIFETKFNIVRDCYAIFRENKIIVNEKYFLSLLLADMHGAYEVSGCARQFK